MQFQVPQNITMEDRIAGPLTAIQFGIVVIGGLAAFFVFTNQTFPGTVSKILGGGIAFITVILAFGRFNDQPMYRFFRFIILFLFSPKVRVWHKMGVEPVLIRKPEKKQSNGEQVTVKKVSRDDIARLAMVLDSRGSNGIVPKVETAHIEKTTPSSAHQPPSYGS